MKRLPTLTIAVAVACALAGTANGDGGGANPGVVVLSGGVLSPNGKTRYVAIPDGVRTVVAQILVRNGAVLRSLTLNGRYGVAYVTNDGTVGGLSFNGRVLVLSAYSGQTVRRRTSRFAVVDIKRWQPGETLRLRGDLTFDALSPTGRMLYLIEHTSRQDYNRYRVRAYDLAYGRMLHRTIVDRREPSDVMVGSPTARATSPGGGWVYTLYQRSNGSSFVHALDTRRSEAVCIDLPRKATKSWRYGASLLVTSDGTQLRIRPFPKQRLAAVVDTRTFGVKVLTRV